MPTVVSKRTENIINLPEDIFSYDHDKFYEFIKKTHGTDLAELFSFQAIRNATHLMDTSCDDILLILQEESEDINNLKKLCCFQVAGNKFQVKLGVKLAIKNLIQSLKTRKEQKQKQKRSSNQRSSSNIDTLTTTNETSSQNKAISLESASSISSVVDTLTTTNETSSQDKVISLESASSISLVADTLPKPSQVKRIQQTLDDIGHIADIEQRLNQWWIATNDNQNVSLEEGVHYFLEINKSINNKYACILSCRCHSRFKLPFTATGFFKLSSFYRHIKEKQCFEQFLKAKHGKENNLVGNRNSTATQSKTSNGSSNTGLKKSKTSTHTASKRFRSSSTLDTDTAANKKSRPLASNTINTSKEKTTDDNNEY